MRELERVGIAEPTPPHVEYRLSESGRSLLRWAFVRVRLPLRNHPHHRTHPERHSTSGPVRRLPLTGESRG
ncbi:hypothetical protein CcI49_11165 [Frankia sp. CcI49]|nr:hypothetical protein ACG83_24080 [Frankia sp. R43]ONH60602.1 hypothetical protein CcI49_11165 [Frankia sp. CcI49]